MRQLAPLPLVAALLLLPDVAMAEQPRTRNLVLAGSAMAVPTYFTGVLLHEGSHALSAKAFGAEITRFQWLPGRHPINKRFYFGYVDFRGRLSKGETKFFLLAPKLTDAALFGGYAALIGTKAVPDNRYGRLAITVFGTGLWVDFTKDLFSVSDYNDTIRVYNMLGLKSEWQRLPARLVHAALSAAGAYVLLKGYEGVFEDDATVATPRMLPILQGAW